MCELLDLKFLFIAFGIGFFACFLVMEFIREVF